MCEQRRQIEGSVVDIEIKRAHLQRGYERTKNLKNILQLLPGSSDASHNESAVCYPWSIGIRGGKGVQNVYPALKTRTSWITSTLIINEKQNTPSLYSSC